ncbi:MAG: hypothetical protein R3F02_06275 [Thiolinea sp.]
MNSYRSVAGEFYFAHQRDNPGVPDDGFDGLVPVNSPKKAEELADVYNQLNALLRKELQARYAALEV